MSRKKETYGSITRKLTALLEHQEQEKHRMAKVMAEELLTDKIAVRIGDFSDPALRKIMRYLSGYLEDCIALVEEDKKALRYQAITDQNVHSSNDQVGSYVNQMSITDGVQ